MCFSPEAKKRTSGAQGDAWDLHVFAIQLHFLTIPGRLNGLSLSFSSEMDS